MWEKIKKIGGWIKANWKILLIILASVGLATVILLWMHKNKKIRELQTQLCLLKTKMELEKLAQQNGVMTNELEELKKQDSVLVDEIKKIEDSFKESVGSNMTAEEIANKFKELLGSK